MGKKIYKISRLDGDEVFYLPRDVEVLDDVDGNIYLCVEAIIKEWCKDAKKAYILDELRKGWKEMYGIPNGFEDEIKLIEKEYKNNVQQTKEQSKELYK